MKPIPYGVSNFATIVKEGNFFVPHQFAFEFKYLKKDATAAEIEVKTAEAEAQIKAYLQSAELNALENLCAWIVVFAGTEAKVVKQIQF